MPGIASASRLKLWLWAALCLGMTWATVGCNPSSLNFLLLPFVDQRESAKCKITSPDKETTVAIVCSFANIETRPELMSFDSELSDRLTQQIRKRCTENKEKIKFVPAARVKGLVNQNTGNALSLQEIGEKLKADFVINLEINNVTLYEKGSYNQLFRGNTEISVLVVDVNKPHGEATLFQEIYRCEYPGSRGPIDVSGSSVLQFRTLYLNKIARDMSRYFAPFSPDELTDMKD